MGGNNRAKVFFDSENATRNGSLRLGVSPQNKASPGQEKILHVWAVRPPAKTNGLMDAYVHPEISRFTPERPNTSVAPPPSRFGGKNYSNGDSKKVRRNSAVGMIESWGATSNNMRYVKMLGEGVSGTVYEVPSAVARMAPLKTTYIVMRRGIPRSGPVAVKFQTIHDMGDLKDAILETQTHAIASSAPASGSQPIPADIPQLMYFVPKLYAAWYDSSTRLFVTIMEMVSGEPLGDIIETRRLKVQEVSQLKKAFAALWARGIFHADAHGDNVFVDSTVSPPRVSILDFGQSVFVPPALRPSSMANAMSDEYMNSLEAYVSKRKAGKSWFNPNTRTLRVAESRSNARNATNATMRSNALGNVRSNKSVGVRTNAGNARSNSSISALKNINASNSNALANRIGNRAAANNKKAANGAISSASSNVFLPSPPANAAKVRNSNINAALTGRSAVKNNSKKNGVNANSNKNGGNSNSKNSAKKNEPNRSVRILPNGSVAVKNGSRVIVAQIPTNSIKKRKRSNNSVTSGKRSRLNEVDAVKMQYSKIVSDVLNKTNARK